jgi:hypothetical protein
VRAAAVARLQVGENAPGFRVDAESVPGFPLEFIPAKAGTGMSGDFAPMRDRSDIETVVNT